MRREVVVDWVRKPGKNPPVQVQREIGWDAVQDADTLCSQYRVTLNDHTLTEQAAIAVMALLIHDLEGGVLQRVVPIGGGGDYFVVPRGAKKRDQVEVSGIREDGRGSTAKRRLVEKADQVLTHRKDRVRVGYDLRLLGNINRSQLPPLCPAGAEEEAKEG
jgi:hypothetical protein